MAMNLGSVFKMITAAIGLEENKTVTDKEGDFICTGTHKVADTVIACWARYFPHRANVFKRCVKRFL